MRVLFVTYPALGLNMGGLQMQIEKTHAALAVLGVEITLYNPWKCDLSDFDIVHVFSLHASLEPIVKAARENNVPVVTSSVFNAYFRNLYLLRAQVILSGMVPGLFSNLSQSAKICGMSSRIISLSIDESALLNSIFGIPGEKITNIPNGIEPAFLEASPTLFKKIYGLENFVLCVGKIERRKNQLALIRVCQNIGIPLVLIGPANSMESDYHQQCLDAAGPGTLILGRLENSDPLLASAYAAAQIFALPSHSEVLPISAFEAIASGCKLLITKKSAIRSELGSAPQIYYCTPDATDIEAGIQKLLNVDQSQQQALCEKIRANYTWIEVAQKIKAVYTGAKTAHFENTPS